MLLALLGCAGSSTEDSAPSAYLYPDTANSPPDLAVDVVSSGVQAVLDDLFWYNGSPVFAAYDEVMQLADDTCPAINESNGIFSWEDNCTNLEGDQFAGFMNDYHLLDIVEGRSYRAEATVTTVDGRRLTIAGEGGIEASLDNRWWRSDVDGVMYYDGPAADGTWVDSGIELSLSYYLETDGAGTITSVQLDGAVSELTGDVSAVSFSELQFAFSEALSTCPEEPYGSLAVRDASGVWADLVFDVEGDVKSGYTVSDEALCDGCGTLWYGGENLGQACIDAETIRNAEVPPW